MLLDDATLRAQIQAATAGEVSLHPGTYRITTPFRIAKPGVRLRGAGYLATTLHFAGSDACLQLNADDLVLENVCVTVSAKDHAIAGVDAAIIQLSGNSSRTTDLRIHCGDAPVVGLLLNGRGQNANHCIVERVRVARADSVAILIRGRDANACVFRDVTVRDCLVGIVDQSFLGNNYFNFAVYNCGPQPSASGQGFAFVCTDSSVNVLEPGFWKASVAEVRKRLLPARNARTTLWGPYVESGQFGYLNPPQQLLAGMPSSTFGCPSFANGELRLVDIVKPTVHVDGLRLRSANSKNPGVWSATDGAESVDLNWKGAGKLSGRLPKAR